MSHSAGRSRCLLCFLGRQHRIRLHLHSHGRLRFMAGKTSLHHKAASLHAARHGYRRRRCVYHSLQPTRQASHSSELRQPALRCRQVDYRRALDRRHRSQLGYDPATASRLRFEGQGRVNTWYKRQDDKGRNRRVEDERIANEWIAHEWVAIEWFLIQKDYIR